MIIGFAVVLVAVFLTGWVLCGAIADNTAAINQLTDALLAANK